MTAELVAVLSLFGGGGETDDADLWSVGWATAILGGAPGSVCFTADPTGSRSVIQPDLMTGLWE